MTDEEGARDTLSCEQLLQGAKGSFPLYRNDICFDNRFEARIDALFDDTDLICITPRKK
jgi:hypothetical protein